MFTKLSFLSLLVYFFAALSGYAYIFNDDKLVALWWLLLATLTKMEVLNGTLVWAITSLNRKGRL